MPFRYTESSFRNVSGERSFKLRNSEIEKITDFIYYGINRVLPDSDRDK